MHSAFWHHCIDPHRALLCGVLLLLPALGLSADGIPEPGIVLFGSVREGSTSGPLVTTGTLDITYVERLSQKAVTKRIQLKSLGEGFCYVTEIPFETAVTNYPASADSFDLPSSRTVTTTYVRSVAFFPARSDRVMRFVQGETDTVSPMDKGKLEQLDIVIESGISAWDSWQMRYFGGTNIDPNADPDGDGLTNAQEFSAGTDPTKPNSGLSLEIRLASGAYSLHWTSVSERSYSVLRATNVLGPFVPIATGLPGTPPENHFQTTAEGFGAFFRVSVP